MYLAILKSYEQRTMAGNSCGGINIACSQSVGRSVACRRGGQSVGRRLVVMRTWTALPYSTYLLDVCFLLPRCHLLVKCTYTRVMLLRRL